MSSSTLLSGVQKGSRSVALLRRLADCAGPATGTIVGALMATSLTVALLDTALGVLRGASPLRRVLLIQPLAVTVLLVSVLVIAALALLQPVARAYRLPRAPASVALAVLVGLGVLYPAVVLPLLEKLDRTQVAIALVYAAFAVLLGVGVYLTVAAAATPGPLARLAGPALGFPFLAALSLAFILGQRFLDGGSTRALVAALFLASLSCLLFVLVRLGRQRVTRALAVAYVATLMAPLVLAAWDGLHWPKAAALAAAPPVRNIILLTVDSLRRDHVSCYDSDNAATPHIDRLCRDGVAFRRAFSAGPWTLPGLVSLLTGTPATVHRAVRIDSRTPRLPTLAERLRERGYLTQAIVGNGLLREQPRMFDGFARHEIVLEPPGSPSLGQRILRRLGGNRPSTEAITRAATAFVRAHAGEPYFLWVHYFDPHLPYTPPSRFMSEVPPPRAARRRFPGLTAVRSGHFVPDAEEREWIRKQYDGEVRYVDEGIGTLLAELEAARAYEDALIVFSSDHGEEFWEHEGFEHGHSLYNEVLQVPLVIKGSGVPRGRWVEAPVSTQDAMATILDLCGGCGAAPRSSTSLRSLWQGPGTAPSRPLVSTGMLYYDERLAVFFGDKKYIRNAVTGSEALYDLTSDFEERRSLVQAGGKVLDTARRVASEELEAARLLRRELGLPDVGEAQSLDSATLEQLRSLGYVN